MKKRSTNTTAALTPENRSEMAREAQLSLNPYPMPTRHGSYLSPKCGCNTRSMSTTQTYRICMNSSVVWLK